MRWMKERRYVHRGVFPTASMDEFAGVVAPQICAELHKTAFMAIFE